MESTLHQHDRAAAVCFGGRVRLLKSMNSGNSDSTRISTRSGCAATTPPPAVSNPDDAALGTAEQASLVHVGDGPMQPVSLDSRCSNSVESGACWRRPRLRDLGRCLALPARTRPPQWPSMLNHRSPARIRRSSPVSPSALSGFRLTPPAGAIQEDSLKPRVSPWSAPPQARWSRARPASRGIQGSEQRRPAGDLCPQILLGQGKPSATTLRSSASECSSPSVRTFSVGAIKNSIVRYWHQSSLPPDGPTCAVLRIATAKRAISLGILCRPGLSHGLG